MDRIECPVCKRISPAGEWLIVGRSTCGFSVYQGKVYDEETTTDLTGAICPKCRQHIEFIPEIKISNDCPPDMICKKVKEELADEVYEELRGSAVSTFAPEPCYGD